MNDTTSKRPSFNDTVDSLTGFEELEIEKSYGADINTLLTGRATMAARALVHVLVMRGGADSKTAKAQSMGMTIAAVTDSFEDDEDDPGEELGDPITDAGKGEQQPG